MSPSRQRSRRLLLMGAALFALAAFFAYRSWKSSEQSAAISLPIIKQVKDFSLIDEDSHSVALTRLRGKVWVANFVSWEDRTKSALLMGRFAELDSNFKNSDRLRLLSIVSDSNGVALDRLKQYRASFEASSRWLFATGAKASVDAVIADLCSDSVRGPTGSSSAPPTRFILIDGKGRIRGDYDGRGDEVVAQLLTELGSLLRAGEK